MHEVGGSSGRGNDVESLGATREQRLGSRIESQPIDDVTGQLSAKSRSALDNGHVVATLRASVGSSKAGDPASDNNCSRG